MRMQVCLSKGKNLDIFSDHRWDKGWEKWREPHSTSMGHMELRTKGGSQVTRPSLYTVAFVIVVVKYFPSALLYRTMSGSQSSSAGMYLDWPPHPRLPSCRAVTGR